MCCVYGLLLSLLFLYLNLKHASSQSILVILDLNKWPSFTALPIGEYAAVALLMFFGFNSIKNAWELPSTVVKNREDSRELGELVEAEELVKEKVILPLPCFSLVLLENESFPFWACTNYDWCILVWLHIVVPYKLCLHTVTIRELKKFSLNVLV